MPQSSTSIIHRLIHWRFLFAVALVLMVFLGLTLGRELLRTHEIQSEINQLQKQANALAARNIALTELQTAVQTQSFIEREARLKLGMKKPGEEVVVIQEGNAGGGQEKDTVDADPLHLVLDGKEVRLLMANPQKWWYYFFDKSMFDRFYDE